MAAPIAPPVAAPIAVPPMVDAIDRIVLPTFFAFSSACRYLAFVDTKSSCNSNAKLLIVFNEFFISVRSDFTYANTL